MEAPAHLPRRNFLIGGAALVGAGVLGLPARTFAEAPAIVKSRDSLDDLAAQLDGWLLRPSDEAYATANYPSNARYGNVLPRAIAMCTSPRDVQNCIKWVRGEQDKRFAIRSGGHNYAGFSTTQGLLIDVKPINGIRLDRQGGTVTIGGGANNQNMADGLRRFPVAVPSGRCPTVGASGLVLGGGWGFSATHSGLTCDALVATDIVLADGTIVTARADNEYCDLFWGLRGGGGGNFGANTAFTFKLHDVGQVTIFNLTWPARNQVELMLALQKIQLGDAARNISTRTKAVPNQLVAHPSIDMLEVTTLGQFFGNEKDLREVLDPAFRISEPRVQDIRTMDYWQARDYLVTDDPTGMYDIRSAYVAEAMPGSGLEDMLRWMTRWPGGSLLPENMGILFAIGGKVHDVAPNDTAYVHRKANFIFEMERSWSTLDSPKVVQAQKDWLDEYVGYMQSRYLMPRTYVNFPSRELPQWADAYYGENLDRLRCLKFKYDRDNLFRFPQSIPLPDDPGRCKEEKC